jgi:hypothetical protein
MQTEERNSPQQTSSSQNLREDSGAGPVGGWRKWLVEAARFWEPRRVLYNLILAAFATAWVALSWPHFRPAMTLDSLLKLFVLGLLANICYCAAYVVDIPFQASGVSAVSSKQRWGLWLAGTLLAVLFENYWIADEIYPYVQ